MDSLRTEIDTLEPLKAQWVYARAAARSDKAAYEAIGVSRSAFYKWAESERDALRALAQKLKADVQLRVMQLLEGAAEDAARVKVAGLHSRNEGVKQGAASEILDRVLGKATQRQEVTGAEGGPMEHDIRSDALERMLEKVYGDQGDSDAETLPESGA